MALEEANVKTGTVLYAFPAFGYAIVLPAGSTNIAQRLFCRLPYQGGVTGSCLVSAPTPGSLVMYKQEGNTRRGYIETAISQGSQNKDYYQVRFLHALDSVAGASKNPWIKQVLSWIKDLKLAVGEKATVAGLQDQQPGDIYIGDKYGPSVFYGRGQLCAKGSDMSYVEFDAFHDKITVLSPRTEIDTLSSQQIKDTNLDKRLKASGSLQGLVGLPVKETEVLDIQDEGKKVEYKDDHEPLFRNQNFSGGAVRGVCNSTVTAATSDKDRHYVIAYEKQDYDGTTTRFGQGFTSIKTLRTSGVSEYPFPEAISKDALKEEEKRRQEALNNLREEYEKFALSDNGLYRILQLAKLLNDKDVTGLLAKDISQSDSRVQYGIDLATTPYNKSLNLKEQIKQPQIADQEIKDYQNQTVTDSLTGKNVTRFDNNSIIAQDPDGSITIKDGWGSQITMSHGNIYISSALDTFIRPGRDLITMVPRHISQAANGQVEIAAKEDIKVGAEKNLVMASALDGTGYTVLENRATRGTSADTGMVIRSNGNLSMTASDDIHIGINDKRTVNNKDKANVSKGSVYIEGERVRLESDEELRLAGKVVGVYAHDGETGAGIEMSSQSIAAVASQIGLDSGYIQVGKSKDSYKVTLGREKNTEVTLNQGQDSLYMQVRGAIGCAGSLVVGGQVSTAGVISASNYIVARNQSIKEISGMGKTANRYIKNVKDQFSKPLDSMSIKNPFAAVLQPWYDDYYICQKELSFFDSWNVTVMPQMCWQMFVSNDFKALEPVQATPTGAEKEEASCAYPGKKAWKECKMTTVDEDFNISSDSIKLEGGYKTHTKKEN